MYIHVYTVHVILNLTLYPFVHVHVHVHVQLVSGSVLLPKIFLFITDNKEGPV